MASYRRERKLLSTRTPCFFSEEDLCRGERRNEKNPELQHNALLHIFWLITWCYSLFRAKRVYILGSFLKSTKKRDEDKRAHKTSACPVGALWDCPGCTQQITFVELFPAAEQNGVVALTAVPQKAVPEA